ncbi:MAG TPA: epoxyqueuosine reductase QueH [Syntrophales bacterium]|nr:epoxyqueuosine reductase QueH [Syntrophales bacterium]
MKLLMHICCAPCTVYPLQTLRSDGHDIHGLFYNPNIHPYREYKKRLDTLAHYAGGCGLRVTYEQGYELERFLRNVAFREKDRCRYCYYDRLQRTVYRAKEGRFDGFTTTLLYSKFQNHPMIKDIGESLASEHRIRFYYQDFRVGWFQGKTISKEMGMYRQAYCGCVYSEKDRFYPANGALNVESARSSGAVEDVL